MLIPLKQLLKSIVNFLECESSVIHMYSEQIVCVSLKVHMEANSLEVFPARLDRAWGNLVQGKVPLPMARSGAGWALWTFSTQTIQGFYGNSHNCTQTAPPKE